jgi:hypothetical protein
MASTISPANTSPRCGSSLPKTRTQLAKRGSQETTLRCALRVSLNVRLRSGVAMPGGLQIKISRTTLRRSATGISQL